MLITEISEKDFRKLDLIVWKENKVVTFKSESGAQVCHFEWTPHHMNNILDEEIEYALKNGYKEDGENLKIPFTIAVHVNNDNKEDRENPMGGGYWDKFMNRFGPTKTYEIGWGIKHLYSSRDYYYAKGDYWRVRKKETAVIYRVYLEPRDFVLKHKTEIIKQISDHDWIEASYDLKDGEWVETGRTHVIKREGSTLYIPVKEKGELNENI